MEELIGRISTATGLDAETVQTAIGHVLAFLQKEGPQEEVSHLLAAMPGAQEAVAGAGDGGAGRMLGGLMGAMGGGVMVLGQKLMAAGLSMDQIKTLSSELLAYGRETAGEDVMGRIVGSIPGLSQFV
jgi:alanine dehydrogenase